MILSLSPSAECTVNNQHLTKPAWDFTKDNREFGLNSCQLYDDTEKEKVDDCSKQKLPGQIFRHPVEHNLALDDFLFFFFNSI